MNIKKSLLLVLTVLLIFSCAQDEILNQNIGSSDLTTYISQYDNSNLGLYKGTFTTLDASERGVLEVKILPNVPSRATLTLSSGATYTLQSTSVATSEQDTSMSFVSVVESKVGVSFDLSVNANGTNIEIKNTLLGIKDAHIIIVKETSRGVALTVAGTYDCNVCGTHPTLGNGSQTFNTLFVSDPSGEGTSTIETQFTLNGVVFTSPATNNSQDGTSCAMNGNFTTCDISGSTSIGSNAMTWTGTHIYNNTATNYSEISGTWTHPGYGGISGTFVSDNLSVPAAIGDLRAGGVVFWVDPVDNTHGLVCALSDYPSTEQWGCNFTDSPSVPNVTSGPTGPGAEIGDGITNTNGILTDCPIAPAALAARSLGPEWFLPSAKELNEMYLNKGIINATASANGGANFTGITYWSSTEFGGPGAWLQRFDDGSQSYYFKDITLYVRAVRAF